MLEVGGILRVHAHQQVEVLEVARGDLARTRDQLHPLLPCHALGTMIGRITGMPPAGSRGIDLIGLEDAA